MDDQNDYRGWDLWLENGQVGTHIINKWPGRRAEGRRARRRSSRASGPTSSSPTTARRKAAGRQDLRQRRAAGRPSVQADTLKGTIRTDGARSRSASGNTTSRLDDVAHPATSGSTAGPCRPTRSSSSPGVGRAAHARRASRPTSGPPPRWTSCSTGGWPDLRRGLRRSSQAKLAALEQEEAAIKARGHDRPRDAGEGRASRWPTSSSAASTTSAATR